MCSARCAKTISSLKSDLLWSLRANSLALRPALHAKTSLLRVSFNGLGATQRSWGETVQWTVSSDQRPELERGAG